MADAAVSSLNTKYNQSKAATRQEDIEVKQGVADLVAKNKPKNLQEFMQLPGADTLYQQMKPPDQAGLPGFINRYAAAANKADNDENYLRLKGLANSPDPDAREEFLTTDPTKTQMSVAQIDNIMTLQRKLKENVNADPRVGKALKIMQTQFGSQLQALGIYSRDKNNPTDFDHYVGTLQAALDAWQENMNKPATYKEIVETIGPQIIRQRTEPNYIFFSKQVPFYTREVPEWYKTKARQIAQDPNYSDELIYRQYIKDQLRTFYGPKKTETP